MGGGGARCLHSVECHLMEEMTDSGSASPCGRTRVCGGTQRRNTFQLVGRNGFLTIRAAQGGIDCTKR